MKHSIQLHSLKDKVGLVTGGTSGIGRSCVDFLADQGAKIAIVDILPELGEEYVDQINQAGGDAIYINTDVSDLTQVESMVSGVIKKYGRLDFAVNNAGILGEEKRAAEYNIDTFKKVIDINLFGVFYCMRCEISQMLMSGGGSIVNMASTMGIVAFRNSSAYVASKHGVIGLTKTAAVDYGEDRIRVNSIGPGFIKTPLIAENLSRDKEAEFTLLHPIGRLGYPEEIASFVGFLISDESSFITGAHYQIDGGYSAL